MRKALKLALAFLLAMFVLVLAGCDNNSPAPPQEEENPSEKYTGLGYTGLEIPYYVSVMDGTDRIVVEDTIVDLDGQPMRTFTSEHSVNASMYTVKHNLGYYGKHQLEITYYTGEETIGKESIQVVELADEYNVVPLIATVPVLYYTLLDMDYDSITEYMDPTVPTIIYLERNDAYEPQALPHNMSTCPFFADSDMMGGSGRLDNADSPYWKYIEYLYKLGPTSKFNYYGNDDWQGQMFMLMDMHIPLDQLKFVFFSDGTGTYSTFRSIYGDGSGTDNSLATFAQYESRWNEIKNKYNAGDDNYRSVLGSGFFDVRGYVSVLVNDPDVDAYWIVSRKNTDTFGSSALFSQKLVDNERLIQLGIADLFNALNSSEADQFKSLYSIDTSQIDTSDGKTVLIFLGTSTDSEVDLRTYLTAMQGLLGDDYSCYYKGHPGHVFNQPEKREKILADLNVKTLDPAIPAELFSLFIEDAVYAGYPSSTFQNVDNECVMLTFKGQKSTPDYMDKVQMYIEKLGENSFRIVRGLRTGSLEAASWDGSSDITKITWSPYTEQ